MKRNYSFKKSRNWREEVKAQMAAIHQMIEGKARCGADPLPPRPEGGYTMYPCRECRIVELETVLRAILHHNTDGLSVSLIRAFQAGEDALR